MDRGEALRKFIRENVSLLTSQSSSTKVVKDLREQFVTRHHLKRAARFEISEVAIEVAVLIRKSGKLPGDEFLSKIAEIPFLKEWLSEDQLRAIVGVDIEPQDSI